MQTCAVIVPVLNGARWIDEALASVAGQTLRPLEVVVVDDGSTDDSAARAAQVPGVHVISAPHRGISAARNTGAAATRADLLAFLDVDDLWQPRYLEAMVRLLEMFPDAPAVLADPSPFRDGQRPVLEPPRNNVAVYDPWALYPFRNDIHCPSQVLVRRRRLLEVGGWHSEFDGAEDTHLYLRLTESRPMMRLESRMVGRRVHRGSLFHELLTRHARDRIERRCLAWLDAGDHRRGLLQTKAERRRLVRQMRCLRRAIEVARALGEDSTARLVAAAQRLEQVMPAGSGADWEGFFRLLETNFCSLTPYRIDPERASRLHASLWASWPSGNSAGRQVLYGVLGRALQRLRQRPTVGGAEADARASFANSEKHSGAAE